MSHSFNTQNNYIVITWGYPIPTTNSSIRIIVRKTERPRDENSQDGERDEEAVAFYFTSTNRCISFQHSS